MYSSIKISEFLHRKKEIVDIDPDAEYALVTVKLHHKGVVLREKKKGSLLGSSMYKIFRGQFILSGIDARNGAFGIVPDELDGAIITNDFWCFDIDEKKVKRDFFYWLSNTPLFLDACVKSSKGETQRIRLQKDLFFNFEFHFPPINMQEDFLRDIQKFDFGLSVLRSEQTYQSTHLLLLRQTILQEAVEGKLTAKWRDKHPELISGDNHASKLLEKIKAEKERLIKEGNTSTKLSARIKKEKPLAPIADAEKPFELPAGWVWCRLGEVSDLITKGSSPNWQGIRYVDRGAGVRFVTSKNVGIYNVDLTDETFVEDRFNEIEPRSILEKGDILTNIVGASIGRTAVYELDEIANINQAVCLIRISSKLIDKQYVLHWMNSPFLIAKMHEDEFAPGRANLSMGNVAGFLLAIPPFAEQSKIIDRLDQLMIVVDELEKQVSERKEQSEMLMQSVLREAFAR